MSTTPESFEFTSITFTLTLNSFLLVHCLSTLCQNHNFCLRVNIFNFFFKAAFIELEKLCSNGKYGIQNAYNQRVLEKKSIHWKKSFPSKNCPLRILRNRAKIFRKKFQIWAYCVPVNFACSLLTPFSGFLISHMRSW